jgi:hypothetical protein
LRGLGKIALRRGVLLAAQIFSGARTHSFYFCFLPEGLSLRGSGKISGGRGVFFFAHATQTSQSHLRQPSMNAPSRCLRPRSLRQYLYFCTSKASTQTSQSHLRQPSMNAPSRCLRPRSLRQYLYFCTSEASTQTSQSHLRQPKHGCTLALEYVCILHVVCCMLYVVCCMLYVVCSMLYIMCIIYNIC